MKLLIATTNPGKIKEFREMLGGDRFAWDDLSNHRDLPAPQETGLTFRANAMLKASYYAQHLNLWAMADDSGLEVDALDGKPGVHSARWAQMHNAGTGDADNNRLLLDQLQKIAHESTRMGTSASTAVGDESRQFDGELCPVFPARFSCVLALCDPRGRTVLTTSGTVEGRIIHAPRGRNGFGYDPLFMISALNKTAAELPADEKHRISHRGEALRRMKALMDKHLNDYLAAEVCT